MNGEAEKAVRELALFRRFFEAAKLSVLDGSIRKGCADRREPDIVCSYLGETAGFELTEACAPEFHEAASEALRSDPGVSLAFGQDVSVATLKKKLRKSYAVTFPVHLVISSGFTALPDALIIHNLRPELQGELGQFRSVWFFGENAVLLAGTAS